MKLWKVLSFFITLVFTFYGCVSTNAVKKYKSDIEWSNTFSYPDIEYISSVQQTKDGGYIIIGWVASPSHKVKRYAGKEYHISNSDTDMLLIKTDSKGNKEWDKTFGGPEWERGNAVQQTNDGGYIIVGGTGSYDAGKGDVWLIKTDSKGNKEWDKTFGGSKWDEGYSVQQTKDGGYIIVGFTSSYGAGEWDVWLIKTDSKGNKEWDKTFGESMWDAGYCVQQTKDGGYIIMGGTTKGFGYIWLIKTDSKGNCEWDKTLGRASRGSGQQTDDGGYIIVSTCRRDINSDSNIWLIKTDSKGSIEWDKTFGGKKDDSGQLVQQTKDGGYIIVGDTYDASNKSSDIWLIKTDSKGNKEWDKTFSGKKIEGDGVVQRTDDGGYIIVGYTTIRHSTGEDKIYLMKIKGK